MALKGNNSNLNILILPELKYVQDFMTVQVTCKFDEDLIKNEGAIMSTFSPLKVDGEIFRH